MLGAKGLESKWVLFSMFQEFTNKSEIWGILWQRPLKMKRGTAHLLGAVCLFAVCLLFSQRWVILFSFSSLAWRSTFAFTALACSEKSGGSGLCLSLPNPMWLLPRWQWCSSGATSSSPVVEGWVRVVLWAEVIERGSWNPVCIFFVTLFLKDANNSDVLLNTVTHQSFLSWIKAVTWYESLSLTPLISNSSGLCTNVTENNTFLIKSMKIPESSQASSSDCASFPLCFPPVPTWLPFPVEHCLAWGRACLPLPALHSAQHGDGVIWCSFSRHCDSAGKNKPIHLLLTLHALKLTYRW